MACGSCGQRYRAARQVNPLITVKGTTKGVIKASASVVSSESSKEGEAIPPLATSPKPVAGNSGPANNESKE